MPYSAAWYWEPPLSWPLSPPLTVAGGGALALFLVYGAWQRSLIPRKRSRRTIASLSIAGFTPAAATALFLLLYAGECGCL
ncbi:lysine transporter LysE [Streptomyces sp. NPDC048590]|uniref:lysine transporter LysE n=1 Tax=Streptomyces sp. NPDC048590 TaxID=3365574 RepID=UPI00371AC0A5